jgi:hypothetical protein
MLLFVTENVTLKSRYLEKLLPSAPADGSTPPLLLCQAAANECIQVGGNCDVLKSTAFFQGDILAIVSDSPTSNIVQCLEPGKSKRNDVYWFVTELLMGEALDEYLDTKGLLSEVDAVKVSHGPSFSLLGDMNGA